MEMNENKSPKGIKVIVVGAEHISKLVALEMIELMRMPDAEIRAGLTHISKEHNIPLLLSDDQCNADVKNIIKPRTLMIIMSPPNTAGSLSLKPPNMPDLSHLIEPITVSQLFYPDGKQDRRSRRKNKRLKNKRK